MRVFSETVSSLKALSRRFRVRYSSLPSEDGAQERKPKPRRIWHNHHKSTLKFTMGTMGVAIIVYLVLMTV